MATNFDLLKVDKDLNKILYQPHLREIAGNASHIKIFLTLCIQFVLCMDCQFMK